MSKKPQIRCEIWLSDESMNENHQYLKGSFPWDHVLRPKFARSSNGIIKCGNPHINVAGPVMFVFGR